MSDGEFTGAKIALVHDGRVLTCLRDDRADIPFPAHWDLPGGGRENEESAEACALRELHEEFGLRLDPARIVWRRVYQSWSQPGMVSHFMGAWLEAEEIAAVVFGNEGQRWEMMPVEAFLAHEHAVPHFKTRLKDFLDATNVIALEAEEGL
jgi:8-oxo-dGTP diphosphatase